jgi:hypothetical protein
MFTGFLLAVGLCFGVTLGGPDSPAQVPDPAVVYELHEEWLALGLGGSGRGACCIGGGCLENLDEAFCEDVLGGEYAGDDTLNDDNIDSHP